MGTPNDGNAVPFSAASVKGHYQTLAHSYVSKANRACNRAYIDLVARLLPSASRVLELGPGGHSLLGGVSAQFKAACDLSEAMLRAGSGCANPVAGDVQELPFSNGQFDAVLCFNMLEHVPDPRGAVAEAARVLASGGRFLAVTPTGNAERLLDLLERLHLKLPEGPHRFLKTAELAEIVGAYLDIIEHKRFLVFPAGPPFAVRAADICAGHWGLFQYLLAQKG